LRFDLWLAYVSTLAVISISPGTGAAAVMATALSHGARAALPVVLGLQVGLVAYALLVTLGLAAVVGQGALFKALEIAGVGYLAWLGTRALLSTPTAPSLVRGTGSMPRTWTARLREGCLVNLTNPKTIVFMAALFPQFLDARSPLAPQLAILLVTLLAVDITVMMGYAHLASGVGRWLRLPHRLAWLNRGLGAWFLVLAVLLAIQIQHGP
jgi:homoserine/homoserine lactone efflux protein